MKRDWWPEAPNSQEWILGEMREEALIMRSRAPIVDPAITIRSTPEHRDLAHTVLAMGGKGYEARAAVQTVIDRAHKVNRSNEVCTEPPVVSRGLTGICFKPRALEGRNLIDKEDWDKIGKPSHQIQVFSWNAGNFGADLGPRIAE